MAEAIVEHGRLYLDGTEMGRKSGDVCMIDGHYYSDKPPAVALLAVPVYAAEMRARLTFHGNLARRYYWTTLLTIGPDDGPRPRRACARFLRRCGSRPAMARGDDSRPRARLVEYGSSSVTFSNHPRPERRSSPASCCSGPGAASMPASRASIAGGALVGIAATADHGAGVLRAVPAALRRLAGRTATLRRDARIRRVRRRHASRRLRRLCLRALGSPLPLSLQPRLFEYPGSYFAAGSGSPGRLVLAACLARRASPRTSGSVSSASAVSSRTPPVLLFVVAGMLRLAFDRTYAWRGEIALVLIPSVILTTYYLVTSNNPGGNSYGVRWFCLFIPLLFVFLADAHATPPEAPRRGAAFWLAFAVSFASRSSARLDPWLDPDALRHGLFVGDRAARARLALRTRSRVDFSQRLAEARPIMSYNAWFQCINGCPEQFSAARDHLPLSRRAATCSRSSTTSRRCARAPPAAWMQLFDERYRQQRLIPTAPGVWGKKEWIVPFIDNENIVSTFEGNSNLFWAERYGRQIQRRGPVGEAVRQLAHRVVQGPRHDRAGVGREADDRRRPADRRGRLRLDRRHLGGARRLLRRRRHPRGRAAAAQQGLAGAARPAARQRRARALRSTPTSTAAWRSCRRSPSSERIYLANSMNSLRIEGQKTVAIEIVQQFDWEVPDWVVIPGGNLGNVSALGKGFLMMHDLGLIQKLPRICVAQARERQPALPLLSRRTSSTFEPVAAQRRRSRARSRSATR